MEINKILFRCSSLGDLMTDDRSGKEMGETAKTKSLETWRFLRENRQSMFTNKYVEKGLKGEEDAITLLSLLKKSFLKKNEERLYNDFITGLPDVFMGDSDSIHDATEGYDTKCSWSLKTFPSPLKKLDKDYLWQNHGYMALVPNAKKWTTAYSLVNAPARLVLAEKMKHYYAMDCPSEDNEQYRVICCEIEKNMIFDMLQFSRENPNFDLTLKDWQFDIPLKRRIIEFEVLRDESKIQEIYKRVVEARQYIKMLSDLNLV